MIIMTNLRPLVAFILVMWVLMLIGGGILVLVVAPIEIDCCGDGQMLVSSVIKASITLGLVILWIFVLSWMKKSILHKMLH